MRMRRIILPSVMCLAGPYFFPHYLTNGTILKKKNVIERKMCVLFYLQTFSETIIFRRRIMRDIIIIVDTSPCKISIIQIFKKYSFSGQIFENTQM
jgi:hypothetical protein